MKRYLLISVIIAIVGVLIFYYFNSTKIITTKEEIKISPQSVTTTKEVFEPETTLNTPTEDIKFGEEPITSAVIEELNKRGLARNCASAQFPKGVDTSLDIGRGIAIAYWWDGEQQQNRQLKLPYEPETDFEGCSERAKMLLRHLQQTHDPQKSTERTQEEIKKVIEEKLQNNIERVEKMQATNPYWPYNVLGEKIYGQTYYARGFVFDEPKDGTREVDGKIMLSGAISYIKFVKQLKVIVERLGGGPGEKSVILYPKIPAFQKEVFIPIFSDGKFSGEIPLTLGLGNYALTVYVPIRKEPVSDDEIGIVMHVFVANIK